MQISPVKLTIKFETWHRWYTRLGLLLAVSSCFALPVMAAETAVTDSSLQAVTLRIDNDLFAGRDRGYSNGIKIGFLSQTTDNFQDEHLPSAYRFLNRFTGWLQPEGFSEYNMLLTVGHGIFTPTDYERETLIEDDRPYVGALSMSLDYSGRSDDSAQITSIELGIVGPSARGEELQRFVHSLLDSDRFRGWDNQLADEIIFRLQSQWLHRYQLRHSLRDNWKSDLIVRGGGSIGNLLTAANAGLEWRFGPHLPDNFGSAPLLPAAVNTVPDRSWNYAPTLKIHGFVSLAMQLVAYDISLDGNLWKDSHSVDREPFIAKLGLGVAASYGKWRFAFARFVWTREFEGQSENPQLGSLTIRRDF